MTHPGSDHTPMPAAGSIPQPPPTALPGPQAWTSLDGAGVAQGQATPQAPRLCPSHTRAPPLSHAGSAPLTRGLRPQVTLGLFGLRGAQAEHGPRAFAALAECCAPFEPGQRYQEFVRAIRPHSPPPPPPAYSFQEFTHRWSPGAGSNRKPGRRGGARHLGGVVLVLGGLGIWGYCTGGDDAHGHKGLQT